MHIAYHFSFSDCMFDFIFNCVSQLSSGLLPGVKVDSIQSDWPLISNFLEIQKS